MQIDGNTRLIGFFGSTYRTSKMYTMYNAALQALGLNYLYVPFAVRDLGQAVAGVRHLGVAAVGVTVPYKIDIMSHLDVIDSDAARIGAVNVVINNEGSLVGRNTDGKGALRALQEAVSVRGRHVTLLGAGGSARAIAFALRDAGAHLLILNRTEQHAEELAAAVGDDTRSGGLERLSSALRESSILINTTTIGMAGTPEEGQSPVPDELLRSEIIMMDIVSEPRETPLLHAAQARGCRVVYGDRMLLWQGVYKFQMYTGVEPPIEVMEQAMERVR